MTCRLKIRPFYYRINPPTPLEIQKAKPDTLSRETGVKLVGMNVIKTTPSMPNRASIWPWVAIAAIFVAGYMARGAF